ncbi:MAG: lysostaphin resistance A-like protein [Thermoplasmata archaeon]
MKFVHVSGSFAWIGVLLVFILLLVIISGYLVWGMSEVIPGIMGQQCSSCDVSIYVLAPFPLLLFSFSEPLWFVSFYIALLVIIISSILLAILIDGKRLVSDMVSSVRDGRLRLSTKSSWAMIGQLFCTYLFFNLAYVLFLALFGVEVVSPSMDQSPLWFLMYELANASVYEEIVTRLVFLGAPMFLIALGSGMRGKPLLKELLGGSGRMTSSTWALIIVSSSIFGIAHIFSWDVYKVVPAFFAGLVLGYVYVKKGIWSSILFHFIVDYYVLSFLVSSEVGHPGVTVFLVLALVVFAVAGFFFFVYYSVKVVKRLGSVFGIPKPAPAAVRATGEGYAAQPEQGMAKQLGFQCHRCGFHEARYSDGKYECLRCGHIQ